MGNIHVKLFKFGPVVQGKMSFKGFVYARRTYDQRQTKTNHNSSH